ncbi:MAG: replication factor C large subunit [Nanoarchaeota archaeon]|nr:replication factor C large subunit [Nanoarchaeota archaeon]
MVNWVRRYQPKKLSEVVGQDEGIKQLADFIRRFKKGGKAAMLHGPTGIGKTVAVYAMAADKGLEVLEVNASDIRNKDALNSILGSAMNQQSLFFKGKIILVDEVDGLSGMQDRGGAAALAQLISRSSFPVMLTANDAYSKKLSGLRKKCQLIEFRQLGYLDVYSVLSNIAKEEKITFEEHALKSLSRRSGGDLRAAINDLQCMTGDSRFTEKEMEHFGDRERKESIKDALVRIFKTKDMKIARAALNNIDEDLDTVMLWIDENLPKEYLKKEDLKEAYDKLSRADVFRGRIRRWQHWRFLVYISALLSAGVAASKTEKYKNSASYDQPKRLLKIWIANQKNLRKKAIAQKIASKTHCSGRRALHDTLPYLKIMYKKGESFSEFLDLDPDEVAWLKA